MSGKYFPNNWEAIKDAPEEYFEPCTWEDFEEWKLSGWDLPSSVCLASSERTTKTLAR